MYRPSKVARIAGFVCAFMASSWPAACGSPALTGPNCHGASNGGYGAAIKSGIKACKFDWIFYTDGDAQYDPRELAGLIKVLGPRSDVINGYKIDL